VHELIIYVKITYGTAAEEKKAAVPYRAKRRNI
jgi:hypothetical protein